MHSLTPKILIIDDDIRIGKNISFAVKREAMEPLFASTGKDGLAILRAESIDLVVLDITLPDINGLDLCKDIRKESDVPIIFLSARDTEIDRVRGLEIGGDDYMVKPFSVYELIARIKLRLKKQRGTDSSKKSLQPFAINQATRTIYFYGFPLTLHYHEYEILMLLLSSPGHVYSRETIKEHVWGDPLCYTDRVVDSHIKNIRNACRTVKPESSPIQTHRGVGYSLKSDL